MSTQQTRPPRNVSGRRDRVGTALLMVLGVAISLAVFLAAFSWERSSVHREFVSLAEDRFHAIGNAADDSARLLHFTDNVFLVGPRVDSPEFAEYLRSLTAVFKADMLQHPSVRAVTWMPRISRSERAAYEQAARAVFGPTFQLGELNAPDSTESGQQDEAIYPHYLCVAVAPHYDQTDSSPTHDPAEWKVMERARDSGQVRAAAPIRMSADPNDRLGYHLFQPIYRGDPGDVASRRQSIVGFLCIDLDVGKLVAKAFRGVPPVGIDVWVSDKTDAKSVIICHHTSRLEPTATIRDKQVAFDELESARPMDFFGRQLLIRCWTTPAFWTGRTIWQPWLLLCVGIALTLTVAGFRLRESFRERAIEQAVATRIAALRREEEQRQKMKQTAKQVSPTADLVDGGPAASVIGVPVDTGSFEVPAAYRGD
jgi:CHASE1-domain containing sensor protein